MNDVKIKKHRLWFFWREWCLDQKELLFWRGLCTCKRPHKGSQLMIQGLLVWRSRLVVGIWIHLLYYHLENHLFEPWRILRRFDELNKNRCLLLLWSGALWMRRSVVFWYFLISLKAAWPGLDLLFFLSAFTPVVTGADFLEIFWEARFFLAG